MKTHFGWERFYGACPHVGEIYSSGSCSQRILTYDGSKHSVSRNDVPSYVWTISNHYYGMIYPKNYPKTRRYNYNNCMATINKNECNTKYLLYF